MINLKIAVRKLLKTKVYTLSNLVGLTLMFSVVLIIFSFVYYHFQFDKDVQDREKIYRIITRIKGGTYWAATFGAFDLALKDLPEIESKASFYMDETSHSVYDGEKEFSIANPIYADSEFLRFFNIKILAGKSFEIDEPNTAMITSALASKIFGIEYPVGKSISLSIDDENKRLYKVAGIVDGMEQSHIQFDIILSLKGYFEETHDFLQESKVFGANIYLKLVNTNIASELQEKLPLIVSPFLENAHGPPVEAFDIELQPLTDIHFTPGFNRDVTTAVSRSDLNILLIVGLLIFLTATFNFLIMNVVYTEDRLKQLQIVQYLGGTKFSILKSRLVEISMIVLLSCILTIILLKFLSPLIVSNFINNWTFDSYSWVILLFLAIIVIAATVIIDAFHFKFAAIANSGKQLRKKINGAVPLIIFQFSVIIALVCFSILLSKQIKFINNKDLGYVSENIMIIRSPEPRSPKINLLKEQVEKIPGVISAGTAQHYPGYRLQDLNLSTVNQEIPCKCAWIDFDALDVLGIKLVKTFSKSEGMNFIINETFYNSLSENFSDEEIATGSFQSPIEENDAEKIEFYVNGVMKDIHYSSLYFPIENFIFFVRDYKLFNNRFLLIRLEQKNANQILAEVQNLTQAIFPGKIIEPQFLDVQLNQEYQSEKQLFKIISWFSVVAIIIACLGLLAFTMFSIQTKTKEIVIRKVNGAKSSEILRMLNLKIVKRIFIAFLIGSPIAWLAMHKWLENFAYKTSISWWIFAATLILVLAIALFTVSWQSLRAARRNPVEGLRYE